MNACMYVDVFIYVCIYLDRINTCLCLLPRQKILLCKHFTSRARTPNHALSRPPLTVIWHRTQTAPLHYSSIKYKIYRSTFEANWRDWDLALMDLFKKISPHDSDEPTRLFVHPCSRITRTYHVYCPCKYWRITVSWRSVWTKCRNWMLNIHAR
jgi:hypothetical protein